MITKNFKNIAVKLMEYFILSQDQDDISIFLCGGGKPEHCQLRANIRNRINNFRSKYKYTTFFPEDLFMELIRGPKRRDLLSLENILAESATSVAILLQSPGTFAELGAFSNHNKLNNKLIILVENKYKSSKSFLNYGPLRYLKNKKNSQSKVIYTHISEANSEDIARNIITASRDMAKSFNPIRTLCNPIIANDFYLSLCYIFDPISRECLSKLIEVLAVEIKEDKQNAIDSCDTVINLLVKEKKIKLYRNQLSTTNLGQEYIIEHYSKKKDLARHKRFLTDMRLAALNVIYRKNRREKSKATHS
ncbi:MAG: retron St85 family effector protein [Planctomycetota bacterium]|jgi:hypothetical protein